MAVTIIMELYDSFAASCRQEAKARPEYRHFLSEWADLSADAYLKDMDAGRGE